jgi:hypothetical protein
MGENRLEVVLSVPADMSISELVSGDQRLIEIREPATDNSTETIEDTEEQPSFTEGDFALDGTDPTPSPEANTVYITEVTDMKASEYMVEETGKTVAEHNEFYPSDDRVVVGYYPHMSGDNTEFAFPESRLRRV